MKEWFLFDQEKQEGPYEWQEVLDIVKHRSITKGALIWKAGMDQWVSLIEYVSSQEQNIVPKTKQASSSLRKDTQLASQAMAVVGGGMALPWQTLIGQQPPDMKQTLTFVAPAAKKLVRTSIKRPALSLAMITIMDLILMLLTGGVGNLFSAFPRLAFGLAASVSGLMGKPGAKANSGPNTLRLVTLVMSALTVLTQGASVYSAIELLVGYGFVGIVPMLVTSASALPVAFKLFWHTAKGVKA